MLKNKFLTNKRKELFIIILSLLCILNFFLCINHWLGDATDTYSLSYEFVQEQSLPGAIYNVQTYFSFCIIADILLILYLPDCTPKAIVNQYADAANRYIDAVNSGKSYEIDNAAAALNKFFDRQNRLLENQKYKYEYMRYLDSQNIPFASSINQVLQNQRQ